MSEDMRRRVAIAVVEAWDMDTLVEYAVDNLSEGYKHNGWAFEMDRKEFLNENEEDSDE